MLWLWLMNTYYVVYRVHYRRLFLANRNQSTRDGTKVVGQAERVSFRYRCGTALGERGTNSGQMRETIGIRVVSPAGRTG